MPEEWNAGPEGESGSDDNPASIDRVEYGGFGGDTIGIGAGYALG
jgi:hypothetical protein